MGDPLRKIPDVNDYRDQIPLLTASGFGEEVGEWEGVGSNTHWNVCRVGCAELFQNLFAHDPTKRTFRENLDAEYRTRTKREVTTPP
jgi:hypothetical protein